jgi:hypothetical protein
MSNTIISKNSNVANLVPLTTELAYGEIAVNTHDGKLFLKVDPGTGAIITAIGDQTADYVWYVSKSGNDDNDGKSLSTAKLTIESAVSEANIIADASSNNRVTIFVKSGDYTENNPITLSPRVTIVGDNLRSVSVRPANVTDDIFWVNNGCYISGITFRGHIEPAAAVAYPSGGAGPIITSPYVQNCSSITTTGAGARIDGSLASGLRSMVFDAYTQINQGGIGIHILNQGYSQLVSIFTICCQDGILTESGGTCSVTNSNSSFGTYALRANGKSGPLYTGTSDGASQQGPLIQIKNLTQDPVVNTAVSFDAGVTLYTIYNVVQVSGSTWILELPDTTLVPIPDNTPAVFYQRSQITTSSHTFEYVGTGNNLGNALPQDGGVPVQANEIVQEAGGEIIFTSTDQRGDFRVGSQLTINGPQGTITGEAFDKSLFAVMTPYILAIEGP